MAGKKKEVTLQVAVINQEQWDELLATKGLIVVDVYQKWCGPCNAVVSLFRKIKNELGDDLLHFATAEADSIDAMERYRGKCEPTFLFYGGGELVAVLHGANAPLLQKMVLEMLEQEKKVIDGKSERKVVKDDFIEQENLDITDIGQSDENLLVPAHPSYTILVIKPDVALHGNVNEIITKILEAGFEILAQEKRILSSSEAEELYQHKGSESSIEELVQVMSSGPCHALLVSQPERSGDVVQAWREFTGTATAETTEEIPNSVQGQDGIDSMFSAVLSSSDSDQARRELALFFPSFRPASTPWQNSSEGGTEERTLALIPPQAVTRVDREEMLQHIQAAGFTIIMTRELTLSEEQARQFYSQHLEKDYFSTLLHNVTSGPVLALALSGYDAVQKWKSMLGLQGEDQPLEEDVPESLVAQFLVQTTLLHGSDTKDKAELEIQVLFPPEETLALIKPDAMQGHRDAILQEIQHRGFSILRMTELTLSQAVAEELYGTLRDKPFFNELVEFVCRYDAVEEWRATMGPTDPQVAQEVSPGSLRARFASDALHSAVHGSSTPQRAEDEIRLVFGDVFTEEDTDNQLLGPEPGNNNEHAESTKLPGPPECAVDAGLEDANTGKDMLTLNESTMATDDNVKSTVLSEQEDLPPTHNDEHGDQAASSDQTA